MKNNSIDNINQILKSERWYLIIENLIRRLFSLNPVSKNDTIIYKIMLIVKKIIIWIYKSIHQYFFFRKSNIQINIIFSCKESQFDPKWLLRIKKLKYHWLETSILSTHQEFNYFISSINTQTKSNYYIIFDRPAFFVNFGLYEILRYLKKNMSEKLFYTDHWEFTTEKKNIFANHHLMKIIF